jgi:hypothetical protein
MDKENFRLFSGIFPKGLVGVFANKKNNNLMKTSFCLIFIYEVTIKNQKSPLVAFFYKIFLHSIELSTHIIIHFSQKNFNYSFSF